MKVPRDLKYFSTVKNVLVPVKKVCIFQFKDVSCGYLFNLTGHSIPKASDTRWSYSFEIVRYACQHYSAIILAFSSISQLKITGSSDGRRYAFDLLKPIVVFQTQFLRDILRPAMKFLRQIEKRGLCLDEFALNVNAARETICQAMDDFDFNSFRATLNDIKQYSPICNLTSHSTRQQQQSIDTNVDENELRNIGNQFVQNVLNSLDERFDTPAQEMIQSLCVLSCPKQTKFYKNACKHPKRRLFDR